MHDCHDVTQHRSWGLVLFNNEDEFGEFPCDVEGRISNTSWELTPNFGEKGTVWFYQLYWSFINMIMIRSDRIRKQNDQVLFSNWLLKIANFIALQRSKCSLHFFSSPCSRISRASYKQQHSIPDDLHRRKFVTWMRAQQPQKRVQRISKPTFPSMLYLPRMALRLMVWAQGKRKKSKAHQAKKPPRPAFSMLRPVWIQWQQQEQQPNTQPQLEK